MFFEQNNFGQNNFENFTRRPLEYPKKMVN